MSDDAKCRLEFLPFEILTRIFSFFPTTEIISKTGHLSSTLYNICNSRNLWRSVEILNAKVPSHIFDKIVVSLPTKVVFKNATFTEIPPDLWKHTINSICPKLERFTLSSCQNVNPNSIFRFLLSSNAPYLRSLKICSSLRAIGMMDSDHEIPTSHNNRICSLNVLHLTKIELSQEDFLHITTLIKNNSALTDISFEGTYPIKLAARELMDSIISVDKLRRINFNNCTLISDDDVRALLEKHCAFIEHLQLRNIQLSEKVLDHVTSLHRLTRLDMSLVQSVSDDFLRHLSATAVGLNKLKLNGCSVTSEGIRYISKLSLSELYVAETRLDKFALHHLVAQRQLEVLDLSHNFIENMVDNLAIFLSQMDLLRCIILYGYEPLVIDVAISTKIEVIH